METIQKKIKFLVIVTIIAGLIGVYTGVVFAADQEVYLTPPAPEQAVGSNFTITVNYDASDANNLLSGIDLSIHYDSSKITYTGHGNFLESGDFTITPQLLDDTGDEDSNPATDRRIHISWTSFTKKWPNVALPVVLSDLSFTVNAEAEAGSTPINISVYDNTANYGVKLSNSSIRIR